MEFQQTNNKRNHNYNTRSKNYNKEEKKEKTQYKKKAQYVKTTEEGFTGGPDEWFDGNFK